ncbi:MAG: hypothetical protein NZ900_09720, partial [Synergistetes bacterium]|nr:hypothetical protein [Synergistota bacterium]MDW8193192.1 hypothetical protein [Synergistota bacterium]
MILIAPHQRNETVQGVKIVALPKTKNRLKRMFIVGAKAFLLALQQRAEIYHFHDPEFLPWAFLLKCIRRRAIIYDIHEDFPEFIPRRSPKLRKFSFLLTPSLRFLLEFFPSLFCDLLVLPTYSLQKKVNKNNSVVLLNLPTLFDFKNSSYSLHWYEKQYDIIHVGTLSVSRFQFMLRVAKYLKEQGVKFKWLFIGAPSSLRSWIAANKDKEFIDKHFQLLDWLP